MSYIAIYAPTLLRLTPSRPAGQPLAGAELSMLHLRQALEREGHRVVCFTNLDGTSPDNSLRSFIDFREQDFELVIYSRTYGHKLGARATAPRRLLWLHDTVEEAASIVAGGIDALSKTLSQYDHLVFVSAWHRLQYQACLPKALDWVGKSTSVQHMLPEISAWRSETMRFDVVHTAHPRKALASVLDIYDLLLTKRPSLRLALVDATDIYQDSKFFYAGILTSLSEVLKARYGKKGPPFALLPAMTQHELISLLAKSEVFLHPDRSTETGATTVLEAIQAGCATVVSDLGCLPELTSTTGSILPVPGKVAVQIYADSVCAALDRRAARVTCDVGQNIRDHNAAQMSRWARVLALANREALAPRIAAVTSCLDFNGLLAAHPSDKRLFLVLPGLRNCRLAVHLLPEWGMALLGVLEPTVLPTVQGDIDVLASSFYTAMKRLLDRLSAHGISNLVMRISCKAPSSEVLAACLSAGAAHGAKIITIRQLSIALQMAQVDEDRERVTMSPRVRMQVAAARITWTIRRLSGNPAEFDKWFRAYDKHRRSFGAIGLAYKRVRELLNSDGELGVHGAFALDSSKDEVCGFYLILRIGEFATLHSWGTDQRYRSNLHKLLIADAARLARQCKVKCFEYGSDLSEYGRHEGLNSLYRRFGGTVSRCFQLTFSVPSTSALYAPI